MRKIFSLGALAMLLMANAAHSQTSLRPQLEKAWFDYNAAIKAKDVNKLKQSWSSYQYSVARNQAVLSKTKFPKVFFMQRNEEKPMVDDIRKLTPGATTQRGDTASQIYYAVTKVRPGIDAKGVGHGYFVIILFVKEDNRWKYDQILGGFLTPSQTQQAIRKQKISPILGAELLLSGKVLPPLPEVEEPDFVGEVYVETRGFKVSVSVNGGPKTVMTDKDYSSFLAGLRAGKNIIEYSVESAGKARKYPNEPAKIQVKARRSGTAMFDLDLEAHVFSFETKTVVGTTKKEFFVDEKLIPKNGY